MQQSFYCRTTIPGLSTYISYWLQDFQVSWNYFQALSSPINHHRYAYNLLKPPFNTVKATSTILPVTPCHISLDSSRMSSVIFRQEEKFTIKLFIVIIYTYITILLSANSATLTFLYQKDRIFPDFHSLTTSNFTCPDFPGIQVWYKTFYFTWNYVVRRTEFLPREKNQKNCQ